MKRVILLTLLLLCVFQGFSQTSGISYQAVILNPNTQELPGQDVQDNILANAKVVIKFSIINETEYTEYSEYHKITTDQYGMINLVIGTGTATRNSFDHVEWDGEQKKLKVEIDFSGRGAMFTTLSEQDLMFMPQPVTGRAAQTIIDNTSAIDAEIIRAIASEAAIQTNMDQNEVDTNIAIAANTTAITAESTRSQTADATNAAAITAANTNISNNATNIAVNVSNIDDNTVDILTNASGISANTSAITASNTNISNNATTIDNNTTNIALKANIASPAFTGTPIAPTAPVGANTTQIATTAFVKTAVSNAASDDIVLDADGDTKIQLEKNADEDMIRFDVAGSEAAIIDANGNFGIGTSTPMEKLHISGNDSDINLSTYGDGVSTIHFERAYGTQGAPAIASSSSRLGFIEFKAWDGSQFGDAAAIYSYTDGTQGTESTPGSLRFATTPEDSDSYVRRMEIESDGDVTIYNDLYIEDDLKVTDYISTGEDGQDGELRIYSEQGATDYEYLIKPNVAATQDVTLTLPADDGTASQVLQTDGTGVLSWVTPFSGSFVREVADEFSATAAQTSFTLTQSPSSDSKVKMYINGIRISNTAYGVIGTTITYVPANNGGYALSTSDRIQFDFYY